MRRKKVILFMIVIGVLAGMMTGCGNSAQLLTSNQQAEDEGNTEHGTENVMTKEQQEDFREVTADFSMELFAKSIEKKKNSMVSPTSVLMAMTMAENGAAGNTLVEMQDTLGQGASLEVQNSTLSSWYHALPSAEHAKLDVANSIWIKDNEDAIHVEDDFLKENQKYYEAQIYKAAFDDATIKDINGWVEENTDGMIDEIVDEIPAQVVMYLINAVAFDTRWQDVYEVVQVSEAAFTNADGDVKQTDMMYSQESRYIETEDATGFIKPYEEGYSFVALLPEKGMTVEDYIEGLDGEEFLSGIEKAENVSVLTMLPKFEAEYTVTLNQVLQDMGIRDAFDPVRADFSETGSADGGPLYISKVLHKTFISVDELGTKAGAVTVVAKESGSAMMEEPKQVYLDRPFVYAIIEDESSLPIFIGTVQDVEQSE